MGIRGICVSFNAAFRYEGILGPTDVRIDQKGFACCKAVVLNDDLLHWPLYELYVWLMDICEIAFSKRRVSETTLWRLINSIASYNIQSCVPRVSVLFFNDFPWIWASKQF